MIDHANVYFFLLISLRTNSQSLSNVSTCTALCDSFCTTCCIFAAWIGLQLSKLYEHTIFYNFFFFFCYVNLSNLENVLILYTSIPQNGQMHSNCFNVFDHFAKLALKGLKSNLRKERAKDCIFRASVGTHLDKLLAPCQPWWHICMFNASWNYNMNGNNM